MPSAIILLADGIEEVEALAPVDVLRRAGVDVTLACPGESLDLTGRNNVRLCAETHFEDCADNLYNMVIIPGGPGHTRLKENPAVLAFLQRHAGAGCFTCAICAGPTVLKEAGLLEGRAYTAHPSVATKLPDLDPDRDVVRDGSVITSRGAGTAVDFGLALVAALCGEETAEEVRVAICA